MNGETLNERRRHEAAERSEERFSLEPDRPIEVAVHNPNGDVVVRGTDGDDVVIRATKHGRPGTPRYDDATLEIDARDNRFEVRPHLPGFAGWAGVGISVNVGAFGRGTARAEAGPGAIQVGAVGGEVRYDLEVDLPRRAVTARIEIRTASGDVAVEEVDATLSLATASGDARVRGVRGEINAHSASGDLSIDATSGGLTVRTASGDIRVQAASLDGFAVQAVSGDVNLDAALVGTGPYRAETVSGDVRLDLAAPVVAGGEPAADLAFRSVSGDATVGPPFRKVAKRIWRAGGEGGLQIAVKTVSGDLHAELTTRHPTEHTAPRSSQGASTGVPAPAPAVDMAALAVGPAAIDPPTPPTPPTAPEPPELPPPPAATTPTAGPSVAAPIVGASPSLGRPERVEDGSRLAVLEAVERGEIDIEEALRRLDAAPTTPPEP